MRYKKRTTQKTPVGLARFGRNGYFCKKYRTDMKKFAILCGLVAAFLCLAQNANAQYITEIHRDRAGFTDQAGLPISDAELINLIGPEIYRETVVGARKQYQVGRKLIIGGAIGMGAGLVSVLGGLGVLAASSEDYTYYDGQYEYRHPESPAGEAFGIMLMATGYVAVIAGGVALDAGIPLHIIGKSRLNWVENDFNGRNHAVTARFGAAPHGVGLTMNF